MTRAQVGKTNWKQALNQAERANRAIRREVGKILGERPGSGLALTMAKVLLAVAESDEALRELKEIGNEQGQSIELETADGGGKPPGGPKKQGVEHDDEKRPGR